MLTPVQATNMFALQASMNTKIDPQWLAARYPYLRAVVIEASEAIEHHGWKWWKKQDKDLPQLQMELIDIWHFMLSEILLRHDGQQESSVDFLLNELLDSETSTGSIEFDGQTFEIGSSELLQQLELLIGVSASKRIEVKLFSSIMEQCELSWAELYAQYVGKNVLNIFRQDHGYKEGSYRKLWSNREDNEHLVEVLTELDPTIPDYKDQLYQALETRYLTSET